MALHDDMVPAHRVRKIQLSPSCGLVRIKPSAEITEVAAGHTVNVALQAPPERDRVSSFTVLRTHGDGDISLLIRRSSPDGVSDRLLSDQDSSIWISKPLPSRLVAGENPQGRVLCIVAGSGAAAIGVVAESGTLSESDVIFVGRNEDCELIPERVIHYVSDHGDEPRNYKVWNTSVLGRPQQEHIEDLIGDKDRYCSIIVCGPAGFCALVGDACAHLCLEDSQLLVESYGEEPYPGGGGCREENALAVIDLFGKTQVVSWPANKNLVTAMIDGGIEPPYSCRAGVCSTCQCSVLIGDAEMKMDLGLSEEEKNAGLVLACKLRPISPVLAVRFASVS